MNVADNLFISPHTVSCIQRADAGAVCNQVTTETQLRGERKKVCLKPTVLLSQKTKTVCVLRASEFRTNNKKKKKSEKKRKEEKIEP